MLSRNRLSAFVILSSLLSHEDRRKLLEEITSADKLRGLAIRDDEYIRSLESWISTIRLILLESGALVGALAITNLVLILWSRQKKEPPA